MQTCNNSFNSDKFNQFLHYVIHEIGSLENVRKTVLFKILYFTDFNYYEVNEENLTGETYRKLPQGPAPIHFDAMIQQLKAEKKIRELRTEYMGYKQKKYISISKPDLSLINANEIEFINKNLCIYSNFNASQISEFSHQDMPYMATDDLDLIDYELVFYRSPLFSVREYRDD